MTTDRQDAEVTAHEERLRVDSETVERGRVRVSKHIDEVPYETTVSRGAEHAEFDRAAAAAQDSGEVEELPDGSLSIPVFEEQIVITKRRVVRERVIVRKHTVYEEEVVTADLRRERVEIQDENGRPLGP